MFTKYLAVVSGDVNIRDYTALALHIFENTDFRTDVIFTSGPLDVLDHSSELNSLGGKMGIDGTEKLKEELSVRNKGISAKNPDLVKQLAGRIEDFMTAIRKVNLLENLPVIIVGLNQSADFSSVRKAHARFRENDMKGIARLILAVDHTVDPDDLFTVAWQILGNTDPGRDIEYISDDTLFIDGTIKAFREGGFPRKWPNPVCSSEEIINRIDNKWESLGIGPLLPSPSARYSELCREGSDSVLVKS